MILFECRNNSLLIFHWDVVSFKTENTPLFKQNPCRHFLPSVYLPCSPCRLFTENITETIRMQDKLFGKELFTFTNIEQSLSDSGNKPEELFS